MKLIINFLLLSAICRVSTAQIDSVATSELQLIKEYALKADDTTLVLLENIMPSIDFENDIETAFEYLMIKYNYYEVRLKNDLIEKVLADIKPLYVQSKNVALKLDYEIACARHLGSDRALKTTKLKTCLQRAKALQLPATEVIANNSLAIVYGYTGKIDTSNVYFDKALKLSRQHNFEILKAGILIDQATFLFRNSNYNAAEELLDIAEKIFQKYNYDVQIANVLIIKADILRERGFYDTALDIYQMTLSVFTKYNFAYKIALVNSSIGLLLQKLDRCEESTGNFKAALEQITFESNPRLYI